MCHTPGVGMQHDGDLGAIVRSAGACNISNSISSSPDFLDNNTNSSTPPPAPNSSSKVSSSSESSGLQMPAPGSFMELISGGTSGLIPDPLAGIPQNFEPPPPHRRLHLDQVKCEPLETTDYEHIFSQSRSLAFMDDSHHHPQFPSGLFTPRAGAAARGGSSSPIQVKNEVGSLDLTTNSSFECGSPSPAASPVTGGVKLESDQQNNSANSNNPGGTGKNQGSKRSRKMQQKRIVCVPVAGGGKPTGEVLPSDMWAWRKYGQKPIKGSPYPRGYYRCSSSKGCSARKQVERCRNDPTMLIITYTSEHNHPWPAHRNSLAGTTRIRPMAAAATGSSAGAANSSAAAGGSVDEMKLEAVCMGSGSVSQQQMSSSSPENPFVSIVGASDHPHQQHQQHHHQQQQPQFQLQGTIFHHPQHVTLADLAGFDTTSRSSSQDEDFFSELEELPELSSILEKGFLQYKSSDDSEGGGASGGAESGGGGRLNSAAAPPPGHAGLNLAGAAGRASVDPFNLFSWSSDSTPQSLLHKPKQEHKQ